MGALIAGPPRWVKVSGIIALALILLVSSRCSLAATTALAATNLRGLGDPLPSIATAAHDWR